MCTDCVGAFLLFAFPPLVNAKVTCVCKSDLEAIGLSGNVSSYFRDFVYGE